MEREVVGAVRRRRSVVSRDCFVFVRCMLMFCVAVSSLHVDRSRARSAGQLVAGFSAATPFPPFYLRRAAGGLSVEAVQSGRRLSAEEIA